MSYKKSASGTPDVSEMYCMEKREEEEERAKVSVNNGQLCLRPYKAMNKLCSPTLGLYCSLDSSMQMTRRKRIIVEVDQPFKYWFRSFICIMTLMTVKLQQNKCLFQNGFCSSSFFFLYCSKVTRIGSHLS